MISYTLPHNHEPREYMLPFWEALDSGVKRLGLVLPRRSGKTLTSINATLWHMIKRQGAHLHYFPTFAQGRMVVWNGMDKEGHRFLDHHTPKELIYGKRDQEMQLTFHDPKEIGKPGSLYQIIGSDNIDRSVGSNPVWTLFDEYSLSDPSSWNFVRPILAENGGTAIFVFTPRGKNHAYRLHMNTKDDPDWFWMHLTVDDTGHIDKHVLERERREIIAENGDDALFWQEYYCDYDIPIQGSVYGAVMKLAEQENRIRDVAYDPALPVHTSWDLGRGDATVIWFVQMDPYGDYRIINHYANRGPDIVHYFGKLKQLEQEYGYIYGDHYLPHDSQARHMESKFTVEQMMWEFFPRNSVKVVPRVKRTYDRISLVRKMMKRCYFDRKNTEDGREALLTYRFAWDEKRKQFKDEPEHDWASDHADAFGQIFQHVNKKATTHAINFPMDHDPY